ncbi:MAG: hypothetical protein ABI460_14235, partial [Caldimonas sp.]
MRGHRFTVVGCLRVAVADLDAIHIVTITPASASAIAAASALAITAVARLAAIRVGLGVDERSRSDPFRRHRRVGGFAIARRGPIVAAATAVVARFLARFGARTVAIPTLATLTSLATTAGPGLARFTRLAGFAWFACFVAARLGRIGLGPGIATALAATAAALRIVAAFGTVGRGPLAASAAATTTTTSAPAAAIATVVAFAAAVTTITATAVAIALGRFADRRRGQGQRPCRHGLGLAAGKDRLDPGEESATGRSGRSYRRRHRHDHRPDRFDRPRLGLGHRNRRRRLGQDALDDRLLLGLGLLAACDADFFFLLVDHRVAGLQVLEARVVVAQPLEAVV